MPRATQGGSDEVESPARPAVVNGVVDEEIEGDLCRRFSGTINRADCFRRRKSSPCGCEAWTGALY